MTQLIKGISDTGLSTQEISKRTGIRFDLLQQVIRAGDASSLSAKHVLALQTVVRVYV